MKNKLTAGCYIAIFIITFLWSRFHDITSLSKVVGWGRFEPITATKRDDTANDSGSYLEDEVISELKGTRTVGIEDRYERPEWQSKTGWHVCFDSKTGSEVLCNKRHKRDDTATASGFEFEDKVIIKLERTIILLIAMLWYFTTKA